MANIMREIEVKARVRDREQLLHAARTLGIMFGDAVTQHDTTYECELAHDDPEWNIFRLRQQGGKTILTMKHKASNRRRDNYEYETIVESGDEIAKMLVRLHYNEGVTIQKRRRIAHHHGVEICLDEIDELGMFIEVEKLADETADVDAVQSELWQLLVGLGMHPEDRVFKGYDTLMHELRAAQRV